MRVVVDAVLPKGTNVAFLPTIDFLDSLVVTLHSRIHHRFAHTFNFETHVNIVSHGRF